MKRLPKIAQKLSLSRETLRGLTTEALSGAVGGMVDPLSNGCPPGPTANNTCTGCPMSGNKICGSVNGQSATNTSNTNQM